jgi:nucleotide-binding universal stress UspA family protein
LNLRRIKPQAGASAKNERTKESTMNLRSILLLLDDSPLCAGRTRFALALARAHGSHLVGLAPTGFAEFPVTIDGAAALVEYAEIASQALRERAGKAAQAFRDASATSGLSVETIVEEAAQAPSIVAHAHGADLVVMSQPDPSASGHGPARRLVEDVVFQAARPTLLIPYAGRFEPTTGKAMVAWDDSREAARALADSLPLLRRFGAVQLVAWNESDEDDAALRARLDAVCRWLARHEIEATARVEARPVAEIADAMLSRAADFEADLIVMGAYGHARWTERVLGGATRGILTSMTVPVLMSH